MANASMLLGVLSPYQGKKDLLTNNQSTGDIIEAILNAHQKYKGEYKKIAKFFDKRNGIETAKSVFDFLKENVNYVIEPSDFQSVKSPTAIIRDGFCDCKCYALFIGGICDALGIPFTYRFSSYRESDKTPQHIFVVIYPNTKSEKWVDPVLSYFDQKKMYKYKIDKSPMALYSISGIGKATAQQKAALKAAKAAKKSAKGKEAKKAAKAEVKAARKAAGRTAGQVLKKGVKLVAKVAASPARNAFLLLVKVNFANLAVKLSKAWEKNPSKLENFWQGIGGNIAALKKQWEIGKGKKRIFGYDSWDQEDTIGAAPVAAAVTAAAPIVAKVVSLLKDIGIEPEELVQIGKDAINAKVQQLVKEKLIPQAEEVATDEAIAENLDQKIDQFETASDSTTATEKPKWIIPALIGGAALVYFATRKK
jgi:hypothetical protein